MTRKRNPFMRMKGENTADMTERYKAAMALQQPITPRCGNEQTPISSASLKDSRTTNPDDVEGVPI